MFGRTGAFTWEDACSLVVDHPLHASFFVAKLWSYFIPVPPPAGVAAALERTYVDSGHQIRPVLEAILRSPELYDDPNQSHFTSRHYWEVGDIDPAGRVGWLGRYLDRHGVADNPLQGLSLDYTLAPSLATSGVPVAAVSAPESYDRWTRDVWDDALFDAAVSRWGAQDSLATADPELAAARRAAGMSTALRTQLAGLQGHTGAWQGAVPTRCRRTRSRSAWRRSPR